MPQSFPVKSPSTRWFAPIGLLLALAAATRGAEYTPPAEEADRPALRIVVMDPLSAQLACDCVAGYAQRDYGKLAEHLERRLGRRAEIAYAEALSSPPVQADLGIDLIVGKFSTVIHDAKHVGLAVRPTAMLTGKDGQVTQTGLFVVRAADAAKSVMDLGNHRLLLGLEDSQERRSAALATLEAFDVPPPRTPAVKATCSAAALAVAEGDADAAVISSYAIPLLEGCGTIDRGALRIVGRTDPVPLIGVFATERIDATAERALVDALVTAGDDPALLTALESQSGFVRLPAIAGKHRRGADWPDWRGPRRAALSPDVPATLSPTKQLLWSRTLTGAGMSGVAVADGRLIVADKDLDETHDVFRCLDADTGRELWTLRYRAEGEMDFTNSPRATPVIHEGLVYLLGAFGDLHCVKLASGEVVWKGHLAADFNTKPPMWGYSSTPLIVGEKLIVNPGAKDASVVALDRTTGRTLWTTPGTPPAYAAFVLAEFGGVRQIVGYDLDSLGGWNPDTGRRLWHLVPDVEGDFNVPTPIVVGDRILVTTENNGTRLYGFDENGRVRSEPLAVNEDLAPDTSTPVVLDGLVIGAFGRLMCLDLADGLRTRWEADEREFAHYGSFIGGNGRVLVVTQGGTLHLVRLDRDRFDRIARLDLFDDLPDTQRDVWSHPALVGNRLFVRNLLGVYCFLLNEP
jgi:outer membrane protein assembly factor BamB